MLYCTYDLLALSIGHRLVSVGKWVDRLFVLGWEAYGLFSAPPLVGAQFSPRALRWIFFMRIPLDRKLIGPVSLIDCCADPKAFFGKGIGYDIGRQFLLMG